MADETKTQELHMVKWSGDPEGTVRMVAWIHPNGTAWTIPYEAVPVAELEALDNMDQRFFPPRKPGKGG
jgi:hypothetical protein